ncbi:MAG TPA: cytochrome c oxidase subunit II [Blastocatellia bacterium]|nr:cytochrome c oxidase subunit II [Blastocatellia bacterium]HMV84076.1 cytochrome c oxidase subunit II [Blastocatellia bacterium]HMZ16860.1 cytochrome c oxidase subunit II [Blastocatellia bacterium]HNG29140.1 cytochrome c oxidase subunit II [Blastocatellia bacterium]
MMGRLLAILIWLLTGGTIAFFAWSKAKTGWWFPEAVSAHAAAMDDQFKLTWAVIGVAFLAAQVALGFVVWRFRAKGGERANHSEGNTRTELLLVAVTTVVFIALAVTGQRVWANLHLNQAPSDAVQVEVTGQQFLWNFRYPGVDGRFGSTSPKLYDDTDNSIGARPGPLGIDPKDPSGKDDVVSGLMVVPVNRPINVTLRAKDVTHDFFVPALRLKQDAVPGLKINIHFTATKEGRYEIACAELCGQLHHQMRAYLEVRSQAEFEKWLGERAPK